MNKSEKIRQLLERDPEMKPAAIRAALARRGVEVEINLIKVVRHHWRVKRKAEERMKAKKVERRQKGLHDLPVGGTGSKKKRKKPEAEIDAEVEEMLNRFSEE
jgi:hypothetical protein